MSVDRQGVKSPDGRRPGNQVYKGSGDEKGTSGDTEKNMGGGCRWAEHLGRKHRKLGSQSVGTRLGSEMEH